MSEFKGSKNWRCANAEESILATESYEFIYAEGGYHSDKTNRGFGISTYMCKEDKNLIIAAPDLLEELQLTLGALREICFTCGAARPESTIRRAEAAIAKALGETK